ncbi:MAG: PUA domain-containing protein [Candidatus Odinarchaeia archaeon]
MEKINSLIFKTLATLFNYQYRTEEGEKFFSEATGIIKSKKTSKIRFVYEGDNLLASINPVNGNIILSFYGAIKFLKLVNEPNNRVTVLDDVENEIRKGKDVYAKHVVSADINIRPLEEVIIVNSSDKLVGLGRAILNGEEMLDFNYGIAVKTRKGYKLT